ncbi:hypothetical protein NC651_017850 [Populus alba x Populus x berolinensis]|nr:hypothetical protein NC651_017850 [Populus alba x Populus x berolinensis]
MIGTAQMKMLINNGDDYQLMLVYSSADGCYSDLRPRNSATACRSDINVIFRD